MSSRNQEQEATHRNSTPLTPNTALAQDAFAEDLRLFNRSPHPYHRSQRLGSQTPSEYGEGLHPLSSHTRSSRTTSDSGTEADDESTGILRGLPAPPLRPRKGLRSGDGAADVDPWLPSLQPWPAFVRPALRSSRRSSEEEMEEEAFQERRRSKRERHVEILRRLMEAALLLSVGGVVLYQDGARHLAWEWRKGYCSFCCTKRGCILIGLQSLLLTAWWFWVFVPPIHLLFEHLKVEVGAYGAYGLQKGATSLCLPASTRRLSFTRYAFPSSFLCRCPTTPRLS